MLENLERVLSEKKQRMEEQSKNCSSTKQDWLQKIDSLYNTIELWLGPLLEKQYANISYSTVLVSEELLGTYEAPAMAVTFFSGEKVVLVPKGLHIVGGKGRVDMKLGLREVMIVGQEKEPGWFLAERVGRGKPRHFDFSQENVEEMLQDLLETM